jgi:hypothetical protein
MSQKENQTASELASRATSDAFADATSSAASAGVETLVGGGTLESLVKLLLLREGREVQKLEEEEQRKAARQKQHDRNAKDEDSKYLLKQARCKHLKGGKKGPKNNQKDYSVYQFSFISGETVIRCQLCGMRWRMQDTVDFLVRNKRKVSNHTKIGWREAVTMCDQSTNTPSSSEIPGRLIYGGEANISSSIDSAGLPVSVSVRPVDDKGNEISNVEM